MLHYTLTLTVLLCLTVSFSFSQFIGLEAGFEAVANNKVEADYIREESAPVVADPASAEKIRGWSYRLFAGITYEKRFHNDKFSVLTGLRYTSMMSTVDKSTGPEYFYLLHRQTDVTTEYLRVRKLQQRSSFIGIPVNIRYFPFHAKHGARLYCFAAGEISYRLQTKTTVEFDDAQMGKYSGDVQNTVGSPSNAIYGIFSGGAGIQFRNKFTLEFCIPVIMTSGISTLVSPTFGGGIHLRFQLPYKKSSL